MISNKKKGIRIHSIAKANKNNRVNIATITINKFGLLKIAGVSCWAIEILSFGSSGFFSGNASTNGSQLLNMSSADSEIMSLTGLT